MILLGAVCACFFYIELKKQEFVFHFGNGYQIFNVNDDLCIAATLKLGQAVPNKVVECGYSDEFIVAKQSVATTDGFGEFGANVSVLYWIIEVPNNKVHGPLSKTDFLHTYEQLKVPASLKMYDTIFFRPDFVGMAASLQDSFVLYQKELHDTGVHLSRPGQFSKDIIPPKIVECNHDGSFIIAKQQLLTRKYPAPMKNAYMIPVPEKFQYWIIKTDGEPETYGPLSHEEYETKRKEVGVPPDLKLRDLTSYRNGETKELP